MTHNMVTNDAPAIRFACTVCNAPVDSDDYNVCLTCSNALRRGETVKADRVYMMPNRVDTFILAKLVKGELQIKFTDEPKWHVWYTALTPRDTVAEVAR